MGGAGVQIVETRIFWEVLWWKHLHMKNMQKKNMEKNMEKPKKTKKTKSSDPCPQPGLSPDLAHGSELLVFFGFLEVLAKLQKTMEKHKKNKNKKSSDPCPQPGLSPDLAHGSELFVFFVFLVFSRFWPNCKKQWKHQKKQKKQKVQTHVPSQASPQTLPMGLNFFVFFGFLEVLAKLQKTMEKQKKQKKKKFRPMSPARPLPRPCPWVWTFCFFLFFFPVFPYFFACVSCEYAFITVRLKKCAFLQFAHLRPPGQIAKKAWKTKLHLMTYIMTNVMIIYIYIIYISWCIQ